MAGFSLARSASEGEKFPSLALWANVSLEMGEKVDGACPSDGIRAEECFGPWALIPQKKPRGFVPRKRLTYRTTRFEGFCVGLQVLPRVSLRTPNTRWHRHSCLCGLTAQTGMSVPPSHSKMTCVRSSEAIKPKAPIDPIRPGAYTGNWGLIRLVACEIQMRSSCRNTIRTFPSLI